MDLEGLCSGWDQWVEEVLEAKSRIEVRWVTRDEVEESPFNFVVTEEESPPRQQEWTTYVQEDSEQLFDHIK